MEALSLGSVLGGGLCSHREKDELGLGNILTTRLWCAVP